jgi:hypothetical protein
MKIVKLTTENLTDIQHLSHILEKQAVAHPVSIINWPEYSYKPKVNFRIGHTGDKIVLKFYVEEEAVRAIVTNINGPVHTDSCVEFFVSVDGKNYYNFEFNCIGTPHVAWGEGRNNRIKLGEEVIRTIAVESTLGNSPFETRQGGFKWELTIIIPIECFVHNPDQKLSGLKASANFYKCGDDLPVPHFVTWNPVGTTQPDYHRPEFFAVVEFE